MGEWKVMEGSREADAPCHGLGGLAGRWVASPGGDRWVVHHGGKLWGGGEDDLFWSSQIAPNDLGALKRVVQLRGVPAKPIFAWFGSP